MPQVQHHASGAGSMHPIISSRQHTEMEITSVHWINLQKARLTGCGHQAVGLRLGCGKRSSKGVTGAVSSGDGLSLGQSLCEGTFTANLKTIYMNLKNGGIASTVGTEIGRGTTLIYFSSRQATEQDGSPPSRGEMGGKTAILNII